MNSVFQQILDGALSATWPEQVATVLGVVGVWLAMRESLWNFPVGLGQVAIFGWVCFGGKLYSETLLQVFFFGALAYGWWHWQHAGSDGTQPLAVQRLSLRESARWTAGTLALWGVWGTGMARWTDAALPYWDFCDERGIAMAAGAQGAGKLDRLDRGQHGRGRRVLGEGLLLVFSAVFSFLADGVGWAAGMVALVERPAWLT